MTPPIGPAERGTVGSERPIRKERLNLRCGGAGSVRLHARPTGRADAGVGSRPGGRAQARDRAVRRRGRLDGVGRAARPGGVAARDGSLLGDPVRGGPPLRWDGRPVHGRWADGSVRGAPRPGGPRRPRLSRGAAAAGAAHRLRSRAAPRPRVGVCRPHRAELRRGGDGADRGRPDAAIRRRGPRGRVGAAGRVACGPEHHVRVAGHGDAGGGLLRAARSRHARGQGRERAGACL